MSGNGIEFAKKVGIVCAAVIAVASVVSGVYNLATRPIMEAIADEQSARISADSMLAERLSDLSRDRISLLTLFEHPPGSRGRAEEIRALRLRWAAEEQRNLRR